MRRPAVPRKRDAGDARRTISARRNDRLFIGSEVGGQDRIGMSGNDAGAHGNGFVVLFHIPNLKSPS